MARQDFKSQFYDSELTRDGKERERIYVPGAKKAMAQALKDFNAAKEPIFKVERVKPAKPWEVVKDVHDNQKWAWGVAPPHDTCNPEPPPTPEPTPVKPPKPERDYNTFREWIAMEVRNRQRSIEYLESLNTKEARRYLKKLRLPEIPYKKPEPVFCFNLPVEDENFLLQTIRINQTG